MNEMRDQIEGAKKRKAPKGTRTQTMFNFRLDNDLIEWVHMQHNMGAYLNELIRQDREETLMGRK